MSKTISRTLPIDKVFELLGGPSCVARLLGLTPWAVSKWRKSVPAERCITLEKLTMGQVRCEQLRPDIDWAYLRNTTVSPRPAVAAQGVLAG
ncbi:helix-turn-helix domain-containing protein [Chromobacterium violaceum]|nr:helix-turn-helix domain-containing protein [Chromobacterium violaceum]